MELAGLYLAVEYFLPASAELFGFLPSLADYNRTSVPLIGNMGNSFF